ncbi:MAG: hypothetical protein M9887_02605 [Chitinophagales bacterium]|nr:hypothetical protein [Chitinophagales bacterium]
MSNIHYQKQAKEEDAEISGAMGPESKTSVIGKYAPKETPVKMSKRFSVNMVSAVNNQGKVHFMIYSDSMNTDRLINS